MQDLGVLPGGKVSQALDINDSGFVVGSSSSSFSDRAFLWTKETGISDLNSAAAAGLGVVFVEARAINKRGEILVMGKNTHLPNADEGTALPEHDDCAPAPPLTLLLTPTP
jgi:probable HAF family extracellular repeat protein